MVYCNLISVHDNRLEYAIGGNINDLTGSMVVDLNSESYEVVKKPENSKVYNTHISSMLRREHRNYRNGIFREQISYEI